MYKKKNHHFYIQKHVSSVHRLGEAFINEKREFFSFPLFFLPPEVPM